MMKTAMLAGACLAGMLALAGCGSADVPRRSGSDDALSVSLPRSTTLLNYSDVEAVLESTEPLNDAHYSMKLFIVSVTARGERPNVIDAGQRVTATPLYDTDPAGSVDLTTPKNQALYRIRSLIPGSKFSGTLGLTNKGSWYLISVVAQ